MKKVIIVLLVMVLCGCQKTIKEERSLFSWHSQDILDDKQLFDMMERYSINSLYQNFKDDDYDDFDDDDDGIHIVEIADENEHTEEA